MDDEKIIRFTEAILIGSLNRLDWLAEYRKLRADTPDFNGSLSFLAKKLAPLAHKRAPSTEGECAPFDKRSDYERLLERLGE